MPARKRKTTYPPPRNVNPPAPRPGAGPEPAWRRETVVTIDLRAGGGRKDLKVGDRVRIVGAGLYAGEAATIEKLSTGPIPTALVRTAAGRSRQVRTIDLEPIAAEG